MLGKKVQRDLDDADSRNSAFRDWSLHNDKLFRMRSHEKRILDKLGEIHCEKKELLSG